MIRKIHEYLKHPYNPRTLVVWGCVLMLVAWGVSAFNGPKKEEYPTLTFSPDSSLLNPCAQAEDYVINGKTYRISHAFYNGDIAQAFELMKSHDPDVRRYMSHWDFAPSDECGIIIQREESK